MTLVEMTSSVFRSLLMMFTRIQGMIIKIIIVERKENNCCGERKCHIKIEMNKYSCQQT